MKIKNYKKHSKEEYDLVMNLRNIYNWGIKRISKYLLNKGISIKKGAVDGWLYCGKKPFEEVLIKHILESSKELTKEKAYILGVLCGDGYISTDYRIGLEACDKEFVDYFESCMLKIYGIYGKRSERIRIKEIHYTLTICSKKITEDLKEYIKSFKSKEWKVPEQIKNAPKEIMSEFIKGIADVRS